MANIKHNTDWIDEDMVYYPQEIIQRLKISYYILCENWTRSKGLRTIDRPWRKDKWAYLGYDLKRFIKLNEKIITIIKNQVIRGECRKCHEQKTLTHALKCRECERKEDIAANILARRRWRISDPKNCLALIHASILEAVEGFIDFHQKYYITGKQPPQKVLATIKSDISMAQSDTFAYSKKFIKLVKEKAPDFYNSLPSSPIIR